MIKAISGGQTGADLAALDAALACGFQTGGTSTWGCQNEDGWHPEFRDKYGFDEIEENMLPMAGQYKRRTRQNAKDSDVTIWLCLDDFISSPGFLCTKRACEDYNKPLLVVARNFDKKLVRTQIINRILVEDTVNFAGNRESKAPGIYAWVYGLLAEVFKELKDPT